MRVQAFDIRGNRFWKDVRIITLNGKEVLDFGNYIRYYVADIEHYYPFMKDFYIDVIGKKHKGFPTIVRASDMNKVFDALVFGERKGKCRIGVEDHASVSKRTPKEVR